MDSLQKEIMGFEVTDELIAINKRYQKLDEIYDQYEKLIEALEYVEKSPLVQLTSSIVASDSDLDSIEDSKELKQLRKMQEKVGREMRKIYDDLRSEIYLHRMLKGAMMMKALKETV